MVHHGGFPENRNFKEYWFRVPTVSVLMQMLKEKGLDVRTIY